ncbi:hypothetical protein AMJ80_04785 [bacterium SM23_31]|nr:MAG: hypothetical protein AMJ80_04785 [bacterium SM23_31]
MQAQIDKEISQKSILAQQLERQGDLEKALILYKELYALQPENNVYQSRIRRILENLKKYEEWTGYIEEALKKQGEDISLLSERARAYYLLGNENEARKTWDTIIQLSPDSEYNYRTVSQFQQGFRLYDDAINTLLLGRENIKKPMVFANELSTLYQIRQDFRLAAREYLNMVMVNPGYFKIAEQVINSFPPDSEVVADVTDELEKVVTDSLDNADFRKLLSGFYIKNREYRKAFASYVVLDSMVQANGNQILSYADQIFQIGEYDYAIQSYTYFLQQYPENENTGQARLGLARSLEKSFFDEKYTDTMDDSIQTAYRKQNQKRALDEYEAVTSIYKNTPWEVEAYYRIGEIKYYRLFDLDGAIKAYETVRKLSPQSTLGWESTLNIGDCYLSGGDMKKAAEYYTMLEKAGGKFTQIMFRAQYNLLMNEYYAENFSDVRKSLEELFAKIPKNNDLSNDILALILFLDENLEADIEPLRSYVKAELLIRQRKLSEAEALLKENINTIGSHPIADDMVFQAAHIQKEMGRYEESIATMQQLIDRFPRSLLLERASITIAGLYEEKLHQTEPAIAEYEKFLRRFGNSIYLDEVRERLRKLQQKKQDRPEYSGMK